MGRPLYPSVLRGEDAPYVEAMEEYYASRAVERLARVGARR